ncbi:HEAT repeat protein [Toxoplasma gondii FOU]|uniref:HEAT repeat protein n=1 Tax=Toxoplasma gondii FOU TaxID=943167 RepID=A0A086JDM6_TOXGO|nr:HEAT repeat protein [Toxoplasma gondii FOU]
MSLKLGIPRLRLSALQSVQAARLPSLAHACVGLLCVLAHLLLSPVPPALCSYRAMTTLRNLNSPKATAMLALVLSRDSSSAILRHEIAFVLGQLRIPSASAGDAAVQGDAPAPAPEHDGAANAPPQYRETPEFLKEQLKVEHSEATAARATFAALAQCLENAREHPMARHEAALALGSLGASAGAAETRWEDGATSVQDTVIRLL